MSGPAGVLVLAATPIGRYEDASPRLAAELAAADVVAAEDTRRLRRLTAALGIELSGRVVSYFEGNERARTASLVEALVAGERVVLVTDAGMPGVSDPGYRLVAAAVEREVTVTSVPGPSAVLSALAVSGLPVDRFCFEGFLPRKAGERSRRLTALAKEERTMVFFEAPHRTHATLAAMADTFGGDRLGAVCRELTKTHEEVRRDTLLGLVGWAETGVRGEVTIVLAGADRPEAVTDPATLATLVAQEEDDGVPRRTSSWVLVSSRQITARRCGPSTSTMSASASASRCGASKNTSVRGSVDSACSARRRSPPLRGRKPSKQNRSTGSPDTASATVTADGPGRQVTAKPASTAPATRR